MEDIKQKADELVEMFEYYCWDRDLTDYNYKHQVEIAILHQKRLIEEIEEIGMFFPYQFRFQYEQKLEEQKEILTELKSRL